jgi:hypothetical protein|tara:strand:- start:28 stop:246 length:219 start_codon:yes stop_codon:yes gene_type:complete
MDLYEKIISLYPTLNTSITYENDFYKHIKLYYLHNANEIPKGKVRVGNAFIHTWNHPTLAQPTQAQLDAIGE